MLTGVEILLERMKTNPEEFAEGRYSKWSRVLDTAWSILTEEEKTVLQDGLIQAKREMFNSEVLRVLTGNDEHHPPPTSQYATTAGSMMNIKPSRLITSESLVREAALTLSEQFDKEHAKKGFGY